VDTPKRDYRNYTPNVPGPALADLIGAWLARLEDTGAASATLLAYRRDLLGVARRLPAGAGGHELHLEHLTKNALRAAFASWAADHAVASVRRAHSCWSGFFDFLVGEDVCDGNPMAGVTRPGKPPDLPRPIREPEAAARLLATAVEADPGARHPWPERDLALVAVFCVTGVRAAEATALDTDSLGGPPGDRHLAVPGRGGRVRSIPVDHAFEEVLRTYGTTRSERFATPEPAGPGTPLLVDVRGRRLSGDQMKYLVERLYVRAGLRDRVPPGALLHALRHSFALAAVEAGADVAGLQALLGHTSLEATRRYVPPGAQGLRRVLEGHPGPLALRRHQEARAAAPG